ncbi:MAG: pilus assembly protein [Chloroflexi bacterium]|nr:MAG: pilus assembly protein [Chloroflexota bacterium]TME05332.1 MAG: pilus assembly protein [Chloroflexota bacterium]TME39128.1 MAG: pilus assembly protein [Chloroflexota bacterium]TME49710.1 MAG: pilus assembly protein [Chloroflexota bacterium]
MPNLQSSQGIVEFALIAPILLILLFGIVDFGRLIFVYATLNQAVNEGARTAIRSSPLLPTNIDVETAVKQHAVAVSLANPCPNGPVTSTLPPANQGWIYITEPNPPSSAEPLSPSLEDAPGGQMWAQISGSCSATNPAHDHAALQVTIRYNFVPITPLIQQLTANHIIISAAATYKTEY